MTSSPDRATPTGSEIPVDDLVRIVESGPFGYAASDLDGRIERVNATLVGWLGCDRDELCGKRTIQDLLAPGDRIYFDTHVRPLLHMSGSVREIAVELVRGDGERIPVLLSARLVDRGTAARGSIETILIDATARRNYERELLRERQHAESSEARLRLMYGLVSGFAAASTVEDVRSVVTGAEASPFAGARCHLWLLDADRRSAVRVGGPADEGLTEVTFDPSGPGSALAQLTSGDLVVVDDVRESAANYPMITGWMAEAGMRCGVIAPLIDDGELFGVLSFGFAEPHTVDADERRAVASLAVQTEQALRRARMHEAQLRSRERLESLHRFSRSLTTAMSFEQVIESITAGGFELLGAGDVRIVRLDEPGAVVRMVGGPRGAPAPEVSIPLGRLDIGCEAIRLGAPVEATDRVDLSERFPASPILANTGLGRVIALPLRSGESVVGAWILGFDESGPMSDDDVTLLELFAEEASHAARRAGFHERETAARRRADRRQAISEALNRAATTAAVTEALAVQGRSAFGADAIAVLLVDEDDADTLRLVSHAGLGADLAEAAGRIDVADAAARRLMKSPAPSFADRPSGVQQLLSGIFDVGRWGAAAVLPVVRGGQASGLIIVLYRLPSALDAETRSALSGVAAEVSVAIGRGRTFDVEHEIAVTLQRSLLSTEHEPVEGWTIDSWYSPGHEHLVVGGDLFDVTRLDDGRFVVLVGDVVGHGLAAASSLGQLRSAAKALSLRVTRPSDLLAQLDDFARLSPGVRGASVCCAMIDADGVGRYACAGHPYPILVTGDGAEVLRDGRSPLLAVGDRTRGDAELFMPRGASLVLYTDGVVERRVESIDVGIERLRRLLDGRQLHADDHARRIGTAMVAGRERADDAVVVCVTRVGDAGGGRG